MELTINPQAAPTAIMMDTITLAIPRQAFTQMAHLIKTISQNDIDKTQLAPTLSIDLANIQAQTMALIPVLVTDTTPISAMLAKSHPAATLVSISVPETTTSKFTELTGEAPNCSYVH